MNGADSHVVFPRLQVHRWSCSCLNSGGRADGKWRENLAVESPSLHGFDCFVMVQPAHADVPRRTPPIQLIFIHPWPPPRPTPPKRPIPLLSLYNFPLTRLPHPSTGTPNPFSLPSHPNALHPASPSLSLTLSTSRPNRSLIRPTNPTASSSSRSSLWPLPKTVQERFSITGTSPGRGMMWKCTWGTTWAARMPARSSTVGLAHAVLLWECWKD